MQQRTDFVFLSILNFVNLVSEISDETIKHMKFLLKKREVQKGEKWKATLDCLSIHHSPKANLVRFPSQFLVTFCVKLVCQF